MKRIKVAENICVKHYFSYGRWVSDRDIVYLSHLETASRIPSTQQTVGSLVFKSVGWLVPAGCWVAVQTVPPELFSESPDAFSSKCPIFFPSFSTCRSLIIIILFFSIPASSNSQGNLPRSRPSGCYSLYWNICCKIPLQSSRCFHSLFTDANRCSSITCRFLLFCSNSYFDTK